MKIHQPDTESFYPASRQEWRQWLQEHHNTRQCVWLICYKKGSGMPTISWSDAVEEALCFGWVDSRRKPLDEEKFIQFFCRRKANSTWSKINKEKIQQLTEKGMMTQAGHDVVAIARQNGSWAILDAVEELEIPTDLGQALADLPGAMDYFLGLSRSVRKAMLQWLVLARRAETRQQRISEIATQAAQRQKPKQF